MNQDSFSEGKINKIQNEQEKKSINNQISIEKIIPMKRKVYL